MKLSLTQAQKERYEDIGLTEESQLRIVKNLIERYQSKNNELYKYRDCSALKDGWQTSNLAKKQRKADELSKEITIIRNVLYDDWNIEI